MNVKEFHDFKERTSVQAINSEMDEDQENLINCIINFYLIREKIEDLNHCYKGLLNNI